MRRLLRVASVVCGLTAGTLMLSLFDVITMPDGLYRACGIGCLLSLFLMVYSRVWLICYRRKITKK